MQIDPTTPKGLAYIADHLGASYDANEFSVFVEDQLLKCEECGHLFTHFHDFDSDLRNDHGIWLCDECAADPENAEYDLAKEEGTF